MCLCAYTPTRLHAYVSCLCAYVHIKIATRMRQCAQSPMCLPLCDCAVLYACAPMRRCACARTYCMWLYTMHNDSTPAHIEQILLETRFLPGLWFLPGLYYCLCLSQCYLTVQCRCAYAPVRVCGHIHAPCTMTEHLPILNKSC